MKFILLPISKKFFLQDRKISILGLLRKVNQCQQTQVSLSFFSAVITNKDD